MKTTIQDDYTGAPVEWYSVTDLLEGTSYMVGRTNSEYRLLLPFGESLVCIAIKPEEDPVEVAQTAGKRLTAELARSSESGIDHHEPLEEQTVLLSEQKLTSKWKVLHDLVST
jgi:hypothetical protein